MKLILQMNLFCRHSILESSRVHREYIGTYEQQGYGTFDLERYQRGLEEPLWLAWENGN